MSDQIELQKIVGEVAAAYFSNNHVAPSEIPVVIGHIAAGIGVAAAPSAPERPGVEAEQAKPTPAQVRRSITRDAIISFEDQKPYKMLRRHLASRGMTPAEYRAKWGLAPDYPMVAPAYSEARSSLAKARGFGGARGAAVTRTAPAAVATTAVRAPVAQEVPVRRQRQPKAVKRPPTSAEPAPPVAAAPVQTPAPAERWTKRRRAPTRGRSKA